MIVSPQHVESSIAITTSVPATETTLATTAMLQATHLGIKRHHTRKASSKVCELEKDRGATALAGQMVKSNAGIAAITSIRIIFNLYVLLTLLLFEDYLKNSAPESRSLCNRSLITVNISRLF